MSVASDVLKMLSDLSASADKIILENNSQFKLPRLQQWISIVHKKADSIVEGEGATESGEMHSLMSYLRGTSERGPRVSTVLTEIHRMHLHRKSNKRFNKSLSLQKTPLRASLRRKSNAKAVDAENTPQLKFPTTAVIEKNKIIFSEGESSSPVSHTKKFAPVEKGTLEKKEVSKRRSSSEISLENLKKTRMDEFKERDSQRKEKVQNSIYSGGIEKKQTNSTGATNVSVLKKPFALQSKIQAKKQDKAVENRKYIMALRQQKMEETKKTREEKMQKAQILRLKLEKEKLGKLRSGKETVQKDSMKSDKEKQLSLPPFSKKTPQSQKVRKSKKNFGPETEKTLNTTYVAFGGEQPSTNSKGKFQTSKGTKTVKPLIELQKPAGTSTPVGKKGPESYAITPASSSFVSYDISEIRSDSEEEEVINSKPIPSWATGVRLRNALLQQHHHPVDTDELFGNVVGLPDLAIIMGVKKKNYYKRTSSAVWNSSFSLS